MSQYGGEVPREMTTRTRDRHVEWPHFITTLVRTNPFLRAPTSATRHRQCAHAGRTPKTQFPLASFTSRSVRTYSVVHESRNKIEGEKMFLCVFS